MRYGDEELKPTFSYKRESKIYYDKTLPIRKLLGLEPQNELKEWQEEWEELGLGSGGEIATVFYLNFVIEDQDFDPQGEIKLYLLTERGEEGVFIVDLSKMR